MKIGFRLPVAGLQVVEHGVADAHEQRVGVLHGWLRIGQIAHKPFGSNESNPHNLGVRNFRCGEENESDTKEKRGPATAMLHEKA